MAAIWSKCYSPNSQSKIHLQIHSSERKQITQTKNALSLKQNFGKLEGHLW